MGSQNYYYQTPHPQTRYPWTPEYCFCTSGGLPRRGCTRTGVILLLWCLVLLWSLLLLLLVVVVVVVVVVSFIYIYIYTQMYYAHNYIWCACGSHLLLARRAMSLVRLTWDLGGMRLETSSRFVGSKGPISGLTLLVYAWKAEGYGFIEFEISNSIILTVFRQFSNTTRYTSPHFTAALCHGSGQNITHQKSQQLYYVGKYHWKSIGKFQRKSTGHVIILWEIPLNSEIRKCHWKPTMISEVLISGVRSFDPIPTDCRGEDWRRHKQKHTTKKQLANTKHNNMQLKEDTERKNSSINTNKVDMHKIKTIRIRFI